MFTDFATIRTNAVIIALGTVHQTYGPNNTAAITLDIDKTIRGTARGPMAVKESPDGHVTVDNERVIAFVDGNGALRWVGRLVAGASLETGVIQLQGFFDFNAHLVHPGIVTLAQLQTLLSTGQLDQTFDATLAFRDGHGGFARSSRKLTIQFAPLTRTLHVIGSTPACLAPNSLFGLEWRSFELRFSETCPSTAANAASRSLDLDGTFTGVDVATGHIQVELVATRPFMTEAEYATFASDGTIAEMTNVVGVALSDGTSWTWRVEKDVVDPSGKAHAAGGTSMSSQLVAGKTVSMDAYDFDGGVKIVLSPGATSGSPGGNPRGIVTLVDSKAIGTCTFTQSGQPARTCTLTTRAPIVVHR
ncbi:MAG TPA: hypothetical protein VH054_24240 [Polyangiaceae bacterium]|nr:hypothetical protein [Polyangiaceae bacterium]